MKKFLPIAALILLVACHPFRTDIYEDELVMPFGGEARDSLYIDMSIEYPVSGLSKEAQERIYSNICTQVFDLEEPSSSLEESAIRYREDLIDLYMDANASFEVPMSWEERIEGSFTESYKNWKTYLVSYYTYRGGPHGLQTLSYTVYDTKTGFEVLESDLFVPGYYVKVSSLLKDAIFASLEEEDAELAQLLHKEAIMPNDNFSIGPEGIEWTFNPYEVGPYALGIVSATIPWEELKPLLK